VDTGALTPEGFAQFRRQPNHDQRHAVGVARDVQARLRDTSHADDPRWLSAALLHDVGKLDSRLGVYGRVVATVSGTLRTASAADAAKAVIGTSLDQATLKKAASAAQAIMSPAADARGPVEYRRHVGGIMVMRALQRAASRAK